MSTKALGILACVLSAALMSGGAAGAASYNGSWPITITNSQYYNGNYCLTLSGGSAQLSGPLGALYGNFQVLGKNLIAIVPEQTSGGFNWGVEFILPARNGTLAKGTFLVDEDGELESPGSANVGTKNGC
jgi:hypothetical protein